MNEDQEELKNNAARKFYMTFMGHVLQAKQGDLRAKDELWTALGPKLKYELYRMGYRGEVLRDMVNEGAVIFFNRLGSLPDEWSYAVKRMRYIAMEVVRQNCKEKGKTPSTVSLDNPEVSAQVADPSVDIEAGMWSARVRSLVLSNARGVDRQIILRVIEGKTDKEIAQELGRRLNGVKARRQRLYKRLQPYLE